MISVNDVDLDGKIRELILNFHARRISILENLKATDLFDRKNPYMYRATCGDDVNRIVETILKARISSSDETVFGNMFVEHLAIFVSGGEKYGSKGSDLSFGNGDFRSIVSVKSGTSSFNSSSKENQLQKFQTMAKTLRTSGGSISNYDFVIGYAYGKKAGGGPNGWIREIAGQEFWSYLSGGDDDLYLKIVRSIGKFADDCIPEFDHAYAAAKNRLSRDFLINYCFPDGRINWDYFVKKVSEK